MNSPTKMLVVIVKESDVWHGVPLYTAVVHRLRQAGVAGATVHAGIMGFGKHHRIHHKGLFGIADDRPITVIAVDRDEVLRAAFADATEMLHGALAVLLPAEVF